MNLIQATFTCSKSTVDHKNNVWNLFKVNNKETLKQHINDAVAGIYVAAGIYLFKVQNGTKRTTCKICSKLTIKTSE